MKRRLDISESFDFNEDEEKVKADTFNEIHSKVLVTEILRNAKGQNIDMTDIKSNIGEISHGIVAFLDERVKFILFEFDSKDESYEEQLKTFLNSFIKALDDTYEDNDYASGIRYPDVEMTLTKTADPEEDKAKAVATIEFMKRFNKLVDDKIKNSYKICWGRCIVSIHAGFNDPAVVFQDSLFSFNAMNITENFWRCWTNAMK